MANHAAKHLATIPAGTLFAGIDLSLDDLIVVVLNAASAQLDRFHADNSAAGTSSSASGYSGRLKNITRPAFGWAWNPPHYWKPVGYDLERHQIPFRLVNALTVKRHREGDHLDRSKDDWRDAFTIADLSGTASSPKPNCRGASMRNCKLATPLINGSDGIAVANRRS